MLEVTVGHIDKELLARILFDSFRWLKQVEGDNSLNTNKLNYHRSPYHLRRILTKHTLSLKWSYNAKDLWKEKNYLALMDYRNNQILLHCKQSLTLRTVLENLFHEYCHSQQSSFSYVYYTRRAKIGYWDHPLEIEANEFAARTVPKYWLENSWKFEQEYLPL